MPTATMLSVPQVAEALSVSGQTVRNMIARGELAAVRVGGQWRIPWDELRGYLASGLRHARGVDGIAR